METIAKNEYISIELDNENNRIIIYDSDNEFINDWYIDDNDIKYAIDDINELIKLNLNEITDYIIRDLSYGFNIKVEYNVSNFIALYNEYGREWVNRIGNNAIIFLESF